MSVFLGIRFPPIRVRYVVTIATTLGILVLGCEHGADYEAARWYQSGYIISRDVDGTVFSVSVSLGGRDPTNVSLRFPDRAESVRILNLGDLPPREPYMSTVLKHAPPSLQSLLVTGSLTEEAVTIIRQRLRALEVISFYDSMVTEDLLSVLLELPRLKEVDLRNATIGPNVSRDALERLRERTCVWE